MTYRLSFFGRFISGCAAGGVLWFGVVMLKSMTIPLPPEGAITMLLFVVSGGLFALAASGGDR